MEIRLKHNCPTDQHYDEKRGRCVNNEMETVSGAENPNSKSRASPNLTFQTRKKRGEIKKI